MRQAHGTLVGWIARAARALEPVERHIKAALARAWVLHHDEAGVRRAGRVAWAHMTSTGRLTHYASHAKRGHAATDAIGILPDFGGVSVHDGWGRYQRYAACHHALCNVPHLRELTFVEEEYQQGWATDMKALLREMKAATEPTRAFAAIWRPYASRARRSWPRSKRSSPVSPSIQPLPDLLPCPRRAR